MMSPSCAAGNGVPSLPPTPPANGKAALGARAERPPAQPVNADGIPAELRERRQWVCWRYERREGKEGQRKWTKVPVDPKTGRLASSTDPQTWGDFGDALARYHGDRRHVDGVGYVFSPDDPFAGVDLDDARDPRSGELAGWAAPILAALDSYAEVSPSGTGVKVFVRGQVPTGGNRRGNVEMYHAGRFFAVTGLRLDGAPAAVNDRQAQLAEAHGRLFGTARHRSPNPAAATLTDAEMIRRAGKAANGAKFRALWAGDTSGYNSPSEADLALCGLLAFWAGPDGPRIDRLFRQSGLFRPKWDERRGGQTYGERTIAKALQGQTGPCGPGQQGEGGGGRGPTQAEALLDLAAGADCFHAEDDRAFATVPVGDDGPPLETLPVRGRDFRGWLCRRYYRATGKAPAAKALQDALGVLEARARYDGPRREVFCRVGGDVAGIYLDLGDAARRAVTVTAQGWRLTDTPPVRFRRVRGMLPLPEPARGASLDELRPFVNVRADDWPLLVGWLVQALRPVGPHPLLCLHGEQGSAKSTTARVLRALVDPSAAALRAEPRDERDLIIAASNAWLVALDNLSHLQPWLSDALCRLATGGGFATRELYSDCDEVIFDARRPALLTGIEDLAARPDLMDRAVILHLPPIDDEARAAEEEFWRRFEAARPRLLGALLGAVSGALRELPRVRLTRLPRMADFARWATAAGVALGWPESHFLDAYEANRDDAASATLDASTIFPALQKFVAGLDGPWEGTCQQLLAGLNEHAGERKRAKSWPSTPRKLSGMLRRLAPSLRAGGIAIDFDRRQAGGARDRLVCIERRSADAEGKQTGPEPSRPSRVSDGRDDRDGSARIVPPDSPFVVRAAGNEVGIGTGPGVAAEVIDRGDAWEPPADWPGPAEPEGQQGSAGF
jgi:hypothetical protein